MITKVMDIDGKEIDDLVLPPIFDTPYRPDIIKKVYVNLKSLSYQPQGRYPAAGEMVSAESRNTGLGIARMSSCARRRIPKSRAGGRSSWCTSRKGRSSPSFLENYCQKGKQKGKNAGFLFCYCSHCK